MIRVFVEDGPVLLDCLEQLQRRCKLLEGLAKLSGPGSRKCFCAFVCVQPVGLDLDGGEPHYSRSKLDDEEVGQHSSGQF